MNWKRYLKTGLGILIALGIIAGGYFFWNNLFQELIFPDTQNEPMAELPEKLKLLSNNEISDYWVNHGNNFVYYLNPSGQVIKLRSSGEELVNSQTINKFNSLKASKNGVLALVKLNYPDAVSFSIFNTATNNWQPLPINVSSADWSPTNQELIYLDDKGLKIFNPDTKKTRDVLKLTQKDLVLNWVSNNTLLAFQTPSAEVNSSLWSLNLSAKTLIPIAKNMAGLWAKWYPGGELGIKLHNENRSPVTSLIDMSGADLSRLSFTTLPSKCLVEKEKIYCAIPKIIKEGTLLPDDYFKKSVYFDDKLYEIDLTTGTSKLLLENSDTLIDAEHLELAGGKLLFKNRYDNKLYSLEI